MTSLLFTPFRFRLLKNATVLSLCLTGCAHDTLEGRYVSADGRNSTTRTTTVPTSSGGGIGSPGEIPAGGSSAGGALMSAGGNSTGGAGDSVISANSGGSSTSSTGGSGSTGGASGDIVLPPANGAFDYQIGGSYAPPAGVVVVSRDRQNDPAPDIYNICYVNGFQVQPDEESWWLSEHPDLILRDGSGDPVIDPDWDEMLLDTRTEEKRAALAEVIGGYIDGCAAKGYDAVEVDNLDTYSRSGGRLSQDDNVALMALLSDIAHQNGMASGQKNSTEILSRAGEMKTDFAVAEECNRYDECGDYQDVYGDLVFVIEYRDQDFSKGCSDFPELSIVRRDLDVSPKGQSGYVYDAC